MDIVAEGQLFTGLMLALVQRRAKDMNLLPKSGVHPDVEIIRLCVLAETQLGARSHAGESAPSGLVDVGYRAFFVCPFGREGGKEKYFVAHQRQTNSATGKGIAGVVPLGLVLLPYRIGLGIEAHLVRIVARLRPRGAVQAPIVEANPQRTMKIVGALVHDHVDHATQRTAVFRLHARGVHHHLIDEVEGNISAGVAANQIGRLLAFNQVRVL